MNSEFGFWVVTTAVVSVIGGIFFGIAYMVDSAACRSQASMMKLQSEYGVLTGCMVDTGDRWAPIEYIRIVDGKVSIQGDGQ